MHYIKEAKDYLIERYNSIRNKKYFIVISILSLILLVSVFVLILSLSSKDISIEKCGDGTEYNACSNVKPYFCSEGKLIEMVSLCGCPENYINKDNSCTSIYKINPRTISLKYTLRGEDYLTDFIVYEGFANYAYEIPRSISYSNNENFSRADFKIRTINEEEQRAFIIPLAIQIQNITLDKEDQLRIAISIVQNIPFGYSNKTSLFGKYEVNHSRYPYEVLYDMQGICGEKTDLLALLLKEMGYGTAFFYYPSYNHEALGIKCPIEESIIYSGYCFVETTGPSIITDNKITYVGFGKLFENPEIYILSEGESLNKDLYEYLDAEKLIRIRDSVWENGWLGPLNKKALEKLKDKYGLADRYYRG
jgi:hypothetical protein